MHDVTARGRDDLDGRPSAPDRPGEPEAVHRSGHLDIREDHGDVATGLQQKDRLVGVGGLQNFEPRFLDHVDRGHAGFVFDDEDHLS